MTFTGTLLPYQDEAVEKMIERQQVLVAYDLGLGKTVLTIAAIEHLRDKDPLFGWVIVVCLSSLKYQWAKEIEKFSDQKALVIDGSRPQRERQYAAIATPGTSESCADYIIVNYEQVVNDWVQITRFGYSALVMDEATAIKGFRSKRAKKVKELSRQIPIRFALTGTPIENGKPEELYSIMQAVDTQVFGPRFDLFDQAFIVRNKFGGVERYRNIPRLHEKLKTASVRKSQTDEDVAPFLPDTIERDPVLVPLDRYSSLAYRHIATALAQELEEAQGLFGSGWSLESHYGHGRTGGPEDAMRGAIMSKITALRMLCDHPDLLIRSGENFDPLHGGGSQFAAEMLDDDRVSTYLYKAKSLKLGTLAGLINDHLSDEENKVVIFTSYVLMADLIRDAVGGEIYTGQMNAKEKEAAKVRFQTDPDTRVLISTDAGGYGVDLPQANMLVNYDLPWSAGLSVQRNGRIRRASSRWPSIVIQDLLCSDTIEVRMHDVLRQKNSVAAAVVDGRGINTRGGVDLTAGSLMSFLREYQP